MTDQQRTDKIRSAASQAAALAAARREMPKLRYGQREHRAPTATDIALGWGETSWANDR